MTDPAPNSLLAPPSLRALFETGQRVAVEAGQAVITAGDTDREVYWVESGQIRFSLSSASGREAIFSEAAAGTLFGELSAIDARARSVIAEAMEPTVLRRLPPARFLEAVTTDPELALWSMRLLTARLRDMTQRSFEMTALTVERRIVAELLRMSEADAAAGGPVILKAFPTHEVFAAKIGTHREAVTRALRKLGQAGVLTQQGRRLTLHDRNALERRA